MSSRTTLPKDFREHGEKYTVAELEQIFSVCDVDARGGYQQQVALAMTTVDLDGARWLLDRGADLEAEDKFGASPLATRAARPDLDVIRLLLERGADPNRTGSKKPPLHQAALHLQVETVELLLAAGADVHAVVGFRKRSVLDAAMIRFDEPASATRALALAQVLLARGATLGEEPRSYLRTTMGKAQRYRQNGNLAAEKFRALADLLELFDITPPAPKRTLAPGEPITVTAVGWKSQYSELWKMLVPGAGAAEHVQGEVIRIIGRVGHEILNNGGGNWDRDFEMMLDAFGQHVRSGTPLPDDDLAQIDRAVLMLRGGSFVPEAIDTLTELSVTWTVTNPERVPLAAPTYRR